jgi:hypothetical protein
MKSAFMYGECVRYANLMLYVISDAIIAANAFNGDA